MADKTGCRVANMPVAKVRVLSGVFKGRYGDDRHPDNADVMHMPLDKAREGVARGDYEILEVLEPGLPVRE